MNLGQRHRYNRLSYPTCNYCLVTRDSTAAQILFQVQAGSQSVPFTSPSRSCSENYRRILGILRCKMAFVRSRFRLLRCRRTVARQTQIDFATTQIRPSLSQACPRLLDTRIARKLYAPPPRGGVVESGLPCFAVFWRVVAAVWYKQTLASSQKKGMVL